MNCKRLPALMAITALLAGASSCAPSTSDTSGGLTFHPSLFEGEYKGSVDIGRAASFTIPLKFTLTAASDDQQSIGVFRYDGDELTLELPPERREAACSLVPALCASAGDQPGLICSIRAATASVSNPSTYLSLSSTVMVVGQCPNGVFSLEALDLVTMLPTAEHALFMVLGSGTLAIDFLNDGSSLEASVNLIHSVDAHYE